jgi:hypothetical protein
MWTLTYNGTEQSAAAWGLTARPVIKTRDRSPTEFSFRMAGAAPEGTIPFPFKAQVIIRQNRIFNNGTWSGSGFVFTGYQTTQPGDVDGKGQGITLVFKDAIWLMQHTTFQQLWTIASSPGNPDWISRCVLFMDINSWRPNTQPIITLIDSDLPARSVKSPPVFEGDEIILTLHDEGDEGRLFKMPSW